MLHDNLIPDKNSGHQNKFDECTDSWLYNIHHPDNYLLMSVFQKSYHQWPNVWPFHSKDLISNSPMFLSAIQFLWCWVGKFGIGSTYNPIIDIFLYSHHLSAWYVIDNVTKISLVWSFNFMVVKGLRHWSPNFRRNKIRELNGRELHFPIIWLAVFWKA